MKTIDIIYASIDDYNDLQPKEKKLIKSNDTDLFGKNSKLDSLGLVSFIVDVEQKVNDHFKTEITLADEKAMSQRKSPFRSVETLASYIDTLIK